MKTGGPNWWRLGGSVAAGLLKLASVKPDCAPLERKFTTPGSGFGLTAASYSRPAAASTLNDTRA